MLIAFVRGVQMQLARANDRISTLERQHLSS